VTKQDQSTEDAGRRRLVLAGVFAWLSLGIVLGELRDPPLDVVRILFRLMLAALMSWFFGWVFTRQKSSGGKD